VTVRASIALVPLLLVASCSSGDEVPEDQAIKPSSAPSGWNRTDLDALTIAAPPHWHKLATMSPTKTTEVTAWRLPTSDTGLEVKVLTRPAQSAETTARALAVNVGPDHITWPDAKDAYLLANEATSGGTDEKRASIAFVFDLRDGRQVLVTSTAPDGSADAKLSERVLSTVRLKPRETSSGGGY
jgi:hypothetical protein